KRQFAAASGFTDRPIPLPGGKELIVQAYSLRGLDIARVRARNEAPSKREKEKDLHEFLTGNPPRANEPPSKEELAKIGTVEPYNAATTPATSLWPQYWMPELAAAEEGTLIGASTSGNDPLEYHFYALLLQYD